MAYVFENGEFYRSFKNPNHIQKSINELNIKGGTCQLENSILHHERLNNKTINNLQFRHFIRYLKNLKPFRSNSSKDTEPYHNILIFKPFYPYPLSFMVLFQ